MKVEFEFHWDRDKRELSIINEGLLLDQCNQYPTGYLDGIVRPQQRFKTIPQYGYLFGEIAVKAMIGYRRTGINVKDKVMAVELLKLEESIDFTEKIVDEFTGQVIARIPKRISADDVDRHELSEFMDSAIQFIEIELNEPVDDPETWKKKRKL